jgi:hypothetical protein
MTWAEMVGTFYAGKENKGRLGTGRGFGHMACCSLFVISQVVSLRADYQDGLNYSWADWNVGIPKGCYSEQMLGLPTNEMLRQWQKAANEGGNEWHFDPKQVAEAQLNELQSGEYGSKSGGKTALLVPKKSDLEPPDDDRPTGALLEASSTPYLKRYEFIDKDRTKRFVIITARPYWLARLAGSTERVIWAPVGASIVECVSAGTRSNKP